MWLKWTIIFRLYWKNVLNCDVGYEREQEARVNQWGENGRVKIFVGLQKS